MIIIIRKKPSIWEWVYVEELKEGDLGENEGVRWWHYILIKMYKVLL